MSLQAPASPRHPAVCWAARLPSASTVLLLVTIGLVSCLSGCAPEPAPASKAKGIILISIDTLGANHLGAYGYDLPTSPFIDSLANRGVLFEHAVVQLPGTLPSHMSMLTGLYPEEHGVFPPAGVLSPEIKTVPELLEAADFRTAGHTEGGYVQGGFGFSRGFEEFSHEALRKEDDVERTFARGLGFMSKVAPEDDFFLFLHTYVVHDPYRPEPQFLAPFWEGDAPKIPKPNGIQMQRANRGEIEVSDEGVDYLRALYDGSILYMDGVLEDFFAKAQNLELSQDVTVILTSDHGEEFREHGKLTHIQAFPETLRVPLIVVSLDAQREAPRRVSRLVESIDIASTLLDLASLESPSPLSGESLVPFLNGESSETLAADEAYAIQYTAPWRILFSRSESDVVWFIREFRATDATRPSRRNLYRLSDDPSARHEVAAEYPTVVERLSQSLAQYELEPVAPPHKPKVFDQDLEDRLRAMGYLE